MKRKYKARKLAMESAYMRVVDVISSVANNFPVDGSGAVPVSKRPNVQMPDEYLPPNKILFLQNLPETVTKDQLMALFSQCVPSALRVNACSARVLTGIGICRYPNLHEVRLIPTKKDIAFVEFMDEASATVAKDALHNYKLDGENKIKVRFVTCLCGGRAIRSH